ncbi:MAG TPA: hypothetical protein EYP25_07105 [Anaerolineae bacterium]|nr:hypothetical protein [Anaerolineae bacterium]HIQ11316.1 hypothetical protein [Caldilineales bacterium]
MIPPAIVLCILLGVAWGALFYLWKGRSWTEMALYIVVAILGFFVGQLIAFLLQLDVMKIGQVHVIEGTLMAWLCMLAIAWLKG